MSKSLTLHHSKGLRPAQILGLGFITVILAGAFLLMLPAASIDGQPLGFVDALFTATSCVCVTGLVVVDTGLHFTTFGHVVLLLLIQVGGLGFMTMATLVFMLAGRKVSLRSRMTIKESLSEETLSGGVRLVRDIALLTVICEGIGCLLLMTQMVPDYGWGRGTWYSVFHSVSAFCNAGFDLFGNYTSYTIFTANPVINLTTIALIITGGLGFAVIFDILKHRDYKKLRPHTKLVLVMTAGLLISGMLFFLVVEWGNPKTMGSMSWWEKAIAALFQSTTVRTAGFNTIDQNGMHSASFLVSIVLMFIGASPASTGGGIKTTTAALLLLTMRSVVRGRNSVTFSGRSIGVQTIRKAMAIVFIGLVIVAASCIAVSLFEEAAGNEQATLEKIVYECTSAFATVGLGTGLTPLLTDGSKVVMAIAMFFGRVGPITLMSAFTRRLAQDTNLINYPEAKIMVG